MVILLVPSWYSGISCAVAINKMLAHPKFARSLGNRVSYNCDRNGDYQERNTFARHTICWTKGVHLFSSQIDQIRGCVAPVVGLKKQATIFSVTRTYNVFMQPLNQILISAIVIRSHLQLCQSLPWPRQWASLHLQSLPQSWCQPWSACRSPRMPAQDLWKQRNRQALQHWVPRSRCSANTNLFQYIYHLHA